jgi:hypothetical protein
MASLIDDVQRTHCSHQRSSTAPGLSMWRVDAKRGVSYSTPMLARPIRLEGLAAGLAERLTRH